MALGVEKGDRIVTISANRAEWSFIDMAIGQVGGIHVPIGHSLPNEDLEYAVKHVQPKYLFTSFDHIALAFRPQTDADLGLQEVICMEEKKGFRGLENVIALGKQIPLSALEKRMQAVKPEDTALMLFTSGTSNRPKAAMLSHGPIHYMATKAAEGLQLNSTDVALNYLPVSHAFTDLFMTTYIQVGMSVHHINGFVNVLQKMQDIRPTFFTTVPLLIEKLFGMFISDTSVYTKEELEHTAQLAFTFDRNAPEKSSFTKRNREILDYWYNQMGGRVRMVVCAGASLSVRYSNAFWAMRISMLELYGMTEASPITFNNVKNISLGTVGVVFPKIKVKLAADGEVLVKGARVLSGYYGDEEANAKAFDADGWFRTGDVGEWIDEKYLKLTGRKRDTFKVSSGEYILPAQIEDLLNTSELINNCLVFEEKGQVALLVVANTEAIGLRLQAMDSPVAVEKLIMHEVDKLYNNNKMDFEHVTRIHIENRIWSVEENDLTPILKKKRNVILKKYRQNLPVG